MRSDLALTIIIVGVLIVVLCLICPLVEYHYPNVSEKRFQAMPKYGSYWELIDPIWEHVSLYDGGDVFLEQFAEISPVQRVLFPSHWAYSEIQNGGLHQFFSNSTGVLAPEAVVGFRELGMRKSANAIESAMKFFDDVYPRDRGVRNEALETYERENPDARNPFDELDDAFYDNADSENDAFVIAATDYANRSTT